MPKLTLDVEESIYELLEAKAKELGVTVEELTTMLINGTSDYLEEISAFASESGIDLAASTSKLLDYGSLFWDEIVSLAMEALNANGKILLEDFVFESIDMNIILDFVSMEGYSGFVDEIRVTIGCKEVMLYAFHVLREGEELVASELPKGFEPFYDSEGETVILRAKVSSIDALPSLETIENVFSKIIRKA
ncbi:MAG: hypothetical protein F7C32_02595 [Desulfurococcales archaeon]|nr:hypothetical protein [Desulfurococcales archaeon]